MNQALATPLLKSIIGNYKHMFMFLLRSPFNRCNTSVRQLLHRPRRRQWWVTNMQADDCASRYIHQYLSLVYSSKGYKKVVLQYLKITHSCFLPFCCTYQSTTAMLHRWNSMVSKNRGGTTETVLQSISGLGKTRINIPVSVL